MVYIYIYTYMYLKYIYVYIHISTYLYFVDMGVGGLRDEDGVLLLLSGLASLSSLPLSMSDTDESGDDVISETSTVPKDEWSRLISFSLRYLSHMEGQGTGFGPRKGLGNGGGPISLRRRGYIVGWYYGVAALVKIMSNLTDGLASSTRNGVSIDSGSGSASASDGFDTANDSHTG
jgi:hypothetical protein